MDEDGNPLYGGTPSDGSVINYVKALKSKGYMVCIYPMLLIDTPSKPWRGHIAGDPRAIQSFFDKYNPFIMHYANLLKEQIDAIIIGSEFKELTRIKRNNLYPAVDQLIDLAKQVKSSVGTRAIVTYAADWSEYHSDPTGVFNMDKLWASENIDRVGIDAYFPLTDDPQPESGFSIEKIIEGWNSGEGIDYFYLTGEKTPFTDAKYRWKDIRHWWETTHINPDGSKTQWQGKMKPIWFTEYGFPSVNGCSNQPNLFIDPQSSESKLPKYSTGRIDFKAQITAIAATITKWHRSDMVEEMFLWTWDARPFPFFPDQRTIWHDHSAWQTGHWVQGKISTNKLGSIVEDLLLGAGLSKDEFDTTQLTDLVKGYLLLDRQSLRGTIETLQQAFFFDVTEQDGCLVFTQIKQQEPLLINQEDLIDSIETARSDEINLPNLIRLHYLDHLSNYKVRTVNSPKALSNSINENPHNLSLPLVLDYYEAKSIVNIHLYYIWSNRNAFKIKLPLKYNQLTPNSIIKVGDAIIRITKIRQGDYLSLEGIRETPGVYSVGGVPPITMLQNTFRSEFGEKSELKILDLPLPYFENCIYAAIYSLGMNWRGASLYIANTATEGFSLVANVYSSATVGMASSGLGIGPHSMFDMSNEIVIALHSGTLESVTELSVLNGSNLALLGKEIIQFQRAELIAKGQYRLSVLLRGLMGTEQCINSHQSGEDFILLNQSIVATPYPIDLLGMARTFRATSVNSSSKGDPITFIYKGNNLKPFSVAHAIWVENPEGDLIIQWVRRGHNGAWKDYVDVPLEEPTELYEIEIRATDESVLRIIQTNSQKAYYTSIMQKADGITRPQVLRITIYQMSQQVGRGWPTTLEVALAAT